VDFPHFAHFPQPKSDSGGIGSGATFRAFRQSELPGGRRKFEINPTKNYATRPGDLKKQQRCGARTRAGAPCQRPAIRGRKRCRLHGGLSPGAPRGPKNGNFKTGDWTSEAINERKWLRSLVQSFAKSGATE
jgi:glucans biosynthesis protein